MKVDDLLSTIEILCAEHGKMNTIVDSSFDGVFEIDEAGEFEFVNPAFCKYFSVNYAVYRNYNFFDVVRDATIKKTVHALFGGKKKFFLRSIEIIRKDKQSLFFDIKMMAVTLREKKYVVGITRDRTDLVSAIRSREFYITSLYRLIKELKIENKETVYYLAKIVEAHDHVTGKHLERIEHYTRLLGQEYYNVFHPRDKHLTEQYVEDLAVSSVLHDIGKVGIPDAILTKPARLTKKEFAAIKKHTLLVGETLESFRGKKDYLSLGREIALAHHERWDGKGYPRGLFGDKIPLSARIVAVCDMYDALVCDRPYRKAMSHEEAVTNIAGERSRAFDPEIVDIFMKIHPQFRTIRDKFRDE
ncbi:MAG: HD domain-containing protein [Spirochaetales bacterium]|nr:HD domain-containing protein [Spirochaetales bacterium]